MRATDATVGPTDSVNAAYSPSESVVYEGPWPNPPEQVSDHKPGPVDAPESGMMSGDGWWAAISAVAPMPPAPNVEGQPGTGKAYGHTTGILPQNALRQPLTGRVLVPPRTSVNPVVGEVGRNNHLGRVQTGAAALRTNYTPSASDVYDIFLGQSK